MPLLYHLSCFYIIIVSVAEWIGPKKDLRSVKVSLGPGKQIQIFNEHGNKKLRQIDLNRIHQLTLCLSSDRKQQYILIEVNQEYDLVLRFDDEGERKIFVSDLQHWLERPDIGIKVRQAERREKNLLKLAITKEERQENIDRFLRLAFAQVIIDKIT